MTPQEKHSKENEKNERLKHILETARSIERHVEEILERLNEYLEEDTFDPLWARDYDEFLPDEER